MEMYYCPVSPPYNNNYATNEMIRAQLEFKRCWDTFHNSFSLLSHTIWFYPLFVSFTKLKFLALFGTFWPLFWHFLSKIGYFQLITISFGQKFGVSGPKSHCEKARSERYLREKLGKSNCVFPKAFIIFARRFFYI